MSTVGVHQVISVVSWCASILQLTRRKKRATILSSAGRRKPILPSIDGERVHANEFFCVLSFIRPSVRVCFKFKSNRSRSDSEGRFHPSWHQRSIVDVTIPVWNVKLVSLLRWQWHQLRTDLGHVPCHSISDMYLEGPNGFSSCPTTRWGRKHSSQFGWQCAKGEEKTTLSWPIPKDSL